MLIKNNLTIIFLYLFISVLLLLPVVSINHSLIHNLNSKTQDSNFSLQQKIQYLNNVKHQHHHQHLCLLCSVWQQNKFNTFFTAFFTLLAFIFLQNIKNKHNFLLPSFVYGFFKTGPPLVK